MRDFNHFTPHGHIDLQDIFLTHGLQSFKRNFALDDEHFSINVKKRNFGHFQKMVKKIVFKLRSYFFSYCSFFLYVNYNKLEKDLLKPLKLLDIRVNQSQHLIAV